MAHKDYYQILGLEPDATQDEIKKTYRKLASKLHPDVNREPGSEDRFKELSEAYGVLSDPEKRKQYDTFGSGGWSQEDIFNTINLEDIFGSSVFEGFFHNARTETPQPGRGQDIHCSLTIDLMDAIKGTTRTIRFQQHQPCTTCSGSGLGVGGQRETCTACRGQGQIQSTQNQGWIQMSSYHTCTSCAGRGETLVNGCHACSGSGLMSQPKSLDIDIPIGIQNGQSLRRIGEGGAGSGGTASGDLYIAIQIQEHPIFKRSGDDLHSIMSLDFPTAVLGGKVSIETVDGRVSLSIPPRTKNGASFRLRNRGVPHLQKSGRGHHYVKMELDVPDDLTQEQEALLKAYAQART